MGPSRRRSLLVLAVVVIAAGLWGFVRFGRTPGQKVDRAIGRAGEAVKDAVKDAGEAIEGAK